MDWFLIKESEHLGPFSEEGIKELHASGECLDEDLVWRDGWTDAKTFKAVFSEEEPPAFSTKTPEKYIEEEIEEEEDDELPPPLPPLPIIDDQPEAHEAPEIPATPATPEAPELQEIPESPESPESPEIPEHPVEIPKAPKVVINFDDEEFVDDEVEKRYLKYAKILAGVLVGCAILFGGYKYFLNANSVFDRPSTMSLNDYETLAAVARMPEEKLDFIFALASDKRTLWASTNNPLEGEVFVNLKSKKGRVLGQDVEVKAKGYLEDNLITFTDFQFVQGTRFLDGYYDVEIYTVDDLKVPFFKRFFHPTERQFRFINEFLISSMLRVDFEKQLRAFTEKRQMNSNEFWIEIEQKYRTIKTITEKIRSGFLDILNADEKNYQAAIQKFKDRYSQEYGVFFTSFVKSNDASYERLVGEEFEDRIEVIGNYTELSKLSKTVGTQAMALLVKLEALDRNSFDQKAWNELIKNSLEPFNKIIEECETKITVLDGRN